MKENVAKREEKEADHPFLKSYSQSKRLKILWDNGILKKL